MKITVVVPAPLANTTTSPRVIHRADMLARDIGLALSEDVHVFEGPLSEAPTADFFLASGLRHDDEVRHGFRVIEIASDRSTLMEKLERHRLAGAIEKSHYWAYAAQRECALGLIGRKDVAQEMGARAMSTGPFISDNYAALESDVCRTLPELIAAYLIAYSRSAAVMARSTALTPW